MYKQNLVALKTLSRRELIRVLRIWGQTLIPPVITMSLYFLIFGNLIGSRIQFDKDGFNYIQFIVPGLIMMSVITNSYSNVVSSFFGSKFQRNIEEILISPTPDAYIILGFVSGGVIRGLIIGFLVTVVSLFFAELRIYNVLVIVSVVLLTAVLFSLGGFLNGIFAKKFDDISIFPTFILTPLTYLGGVFYSIRDLPEFWQTASLFNPIVYMVNAFRYGFLGYSDIDLAWAFLVLGIFISIAFGLCWYLLRIGYGMRS